MRGFLAVPEGWASRLEAWEREFIAGLLDQVGGVLASAETSSDRVARAERSRRAAAGEDGAGEHGAARPSLAVVRDGESAEDAAVLASLDFTAPDPEVDGPAGGRLIADGAPAALAPLIEALLPDASEDPDVAVEVAGMTRGHLRALKHERLESVVAELLEPTGEAGSVLVRRGEEGHWLGALNDARLVLAERLGIEDSQDADDVHAVAYEDAPETEDEDTRWRRGLALAYDMITWWQESLVAVLLHPEARS
ncbi:DUF2017 family protein [Actinomyces radicidentis]|uniref:DUF2017 family protein n=1 Tax=Actinomyces radicidentis TaxID=111015 RepID=UPI0028F0183A|nr:DUF2017 family protein [Actinomyces radicidentis]